MENIGRKLEIFVIVSIIALIGIIYAFTQKPALAPTTTEQHRDLTTTPNDTGSNTTAVQPAPTETPPPASQQVPSNVVEYKGVDGKSSLDLLKASHRVDVKHYSFGDMVIGIDGVAPDANHFWAFYVNGQFSQVGASAYITKNSDTIKWQMDSLSDSTK